MFDQLNKLIIGCLRVARVKTTRLRESFAEIVSRSDEELTATMLPAPLLAFYAARRPSFLLLREVRDAIVHKGNANEKWIFTFPDGFAVDIERGFMRQLTSLGLWPDRVRRAGFPEFGSLLSFFAFMLSDLYQATAEVASALLADPNQLPENLAPGQTVYRRSNLASHLRRAKQYHVAPWVSPGEVLPKILRWEPPGGEV